MHFHVFYRFEQPAQAVSSTRPVALSAKSIVELLPRLQTEDDYLGILDASDNVLQILRDSTADRYWVELPMEGARASYGCYLDLTQVRELVLELPAVLDRTRIPGLHYRPW